jgi:nitroreductase
MDVATALRTRSSIRAFRPDPLPLALVQAILEDARWAPSGGNLQPWRMIVVSGTARDAVVQAAQSALNADPAGEEGDRPVYPASLWEPYRSRRYEMGEEVYALMGVGRDDKLARLGHLARNFSFFDAPVGVFFVTDARFQHAQWSHVGMLMLGVALSAHALGVGSCMQEAWARVRRTLHTHFALEPHEIVVAGLALGYADETAAVNGLRSTRAPLDQLASFAGF